MPWKSQYGLRTVTSNSFLAIRYASRMLTALAFGGERAARQFNEDVVQRRACQVRGLGRSVSGSELAHELRECTVAFADVDLQQAAIDAHFEHERIALKERRGCGHVARGIVAEGEAVTR